MYPHFLIQTVQCFQEADYSSKSRKWKLAKLTQCVWFSFRVFLNFILVYKILLSSLLFSFWPFEKYLWFVQSWRIASFLRVRSRGKNTRSPTPFKVCELHLTLNSSIQPSKPSKIMYLPKCRTESDLVRSVSLKYTFQFNTEKKIVSA